MRLSKKKENELWSLVHEEIMQARVKVWAMRFDKNVSVSEIDDIFLDLCISAPQKALDLFKQK